MMGCLLRCMSRLLAECDLRAVPTNVRSWESNGLNADFLIEVTPPSLLARADEVIESPQVS
jgi:hypothetical protein